MNHKIKLLTCISLLVLTNLFISGQKPKDRIFNDYFFSTILLDYYTSPIFTFTVEENTGTEEYYYQENGFSLLALGWRFRYNVINMGDKSSLSLQTDPSLGFGLSGSGISIPANIPCFLGVNLGAGSTYDDDSKFGIFLGGGLEYNFHLLDLSNTMVGNFPAQVNWAEPAVSLGLRWWNKKYKLKEINVKVGVKNVEIPSDADDSYIFSKAYTLRFTYHTFLNY